MTEKKPCLIRMPEVTRRTSLSESEVYKLMRKGAFPQSVKLGSRVAWVEAEIDAYVESKIAARAKIAAAG